MTKGYPMQKRNTLAIVIIGGLIVALSVWLRDTPTSSAGLQGMDEAVVSFRVQFGRQDREPRDWSGELAITGGEVVALRTGIRAPAIRFKAQPAGRSPHAPARTSSAEPGKKEATRLYQWRAMAVTVYDGKSWQEPAADINQSLPEELREYNDFPTLLADGAGRIRVSFRHRTLRIRDTHNNTPAHRAAWELFTTSYEGSG